MIYGSDINMRYIMEVTITDKLKNSIRYSLNSNFGTKYELKDIISIEISIPYINVQVADNTYHTSIRCFGLLIESVLRQYKQYQLSYLFKEK